MKRSKKPGYKKPVLGFFKKIGQAPLKHVKEFESADNKGYKVGDLLKADLFKAGDFVDVTGTSIGKGFQGGMVRWNWSGGPAARQAPCITAVSVLSVPVQTLPAFIRGSICPAIWAWIL